MSEATIEVDGEVYTLTNPTYYAGEAIEGMTQTGRRITGLRGEPFIEASVSGWEFATVVIRNNDPREAIPCRVTMGGGVVFTARACAVEWSPNPPVTQLRIENLVAIAHPPAVPPTLDEPTDPADLDWGTIRSTCAARDWRAAWGVVGTDHTGDATPGEVYLLAVARRASATAAALCHWRHVCEKRRDVPLAPGNVSWQRIKRIAAWESSARAQGDEAAAHHERMRVRHATGHKMQVTIGGREIVGMADDASATFTPTSEMDANELLATLRRFAPRDPQLRPDTLRMTEEVYNALMSMRHTEERMVEDVGVNGVQGILNNPFIQPFSVRPAAMYEGLAVASRHGSERRAITPAPTKPKARKKEKRSARHTQRRK